MSVSKFICGGIVAALLGLPLAASAQSPRGDDDRSPRESRMLRLLDTNNDGQVSLDEIKAEQGRLIGAADIDGNGELSVDEFRRRGGWFQRLSTTTLFDLMDADGNQVLTADEIGKPSERWFARYDANDDGQLSAEELPQRRHRHKRR